MATVFLLDSTTLVLEEVRQIVDNTYDESTGNFSLQNKSLWDKTDIRALKAEHCGYDVFHTSEKFSSNPHWHYGAEHRLILSGSGFFFIPLTNKLAIIEVKSGDLLWLSPCLTHWFSTNGITSARFFVEENSHIEYKTNIAEETMKLHETFLNGFKPSI